MMKAGAMGETDFEDYAADLQTQNSWAFEAEVSDDGFFLEIFGMFGLIKGANTLGFDEFLQVDPS